MDADLPWLYLKEIFHGRDGGGVPTAGSCGGHRQPRHQPIRRVHIPKEADRTRPIGISATEDKVVQNALREVLEAIYEQDIVPASAVEGTSQPAGLHKAQIRHSRR